MSLIYCSVLKDCRISFTEDCLFNSTVQSTHFTLNVVVVAALNPTGDCLGSTWTLGTSACSTSGFAIAAWVRLRPSNATTRTLVFSPTFTLTATSSYPSGPVQLSASVLVNVGYANGYNSWGLSSGTAWTAATNFSSGVPVGTFFNVALLWSAQNGLAIYVDGARAATAPTAAIALTSSANVDVAAQLAPLVNNLAQTSAVAVGNNGSSTSTGNGTGPGNGTEFDVTNVAYWNSIAVPLARPEALLGVSRKQLLYRQGSAAYWVFSGLLQALQPLQPQLQGVGAVRVPDRVGVGLAARSDSATSSNIVLAPGGSGALALPLVSPDLCGALMTISLWIRVYNYTSTLVRVFQEHTDLLLVLVLVRLLVHSCVDLRVPYPFHSLLRAGTCSRAPPPRRPPNEESTSH